MIRAFMSSYVIPVSSSVTAKPSGRVAGDLGGADVRRHDHDGVPEVHGAPLRVRQAPVLQDLQEDVEHVRVRLLDLVEQEHAVRLAPHGLRELAALVVADVAGGRADEPGHGVLLHVLRHVDADHRVLVAEQELGERARQLRLADADGPRNTNEPVGRFGVLEARAGPADRLRDDLDGGLLADDALVELVLHPHELLRLGLGELEHRDAGPHGDDVGDLLLADGRALLALGLAGLPLLLELALLVRQAPLLVAQVRGLLELLVLDGRLLEATGLLDLGLELAVDGGRRHRLDALARRGLVDEVDGLVGQLAVGDVAIGELRRGREGLVGDLDLVVLLVAVAQALEDLHGLLGDGCSTRICWKRRSSAESRSRYLRYSSSVVAPTVCSSPRARAGLRMEAASIAPSPRPPRRGCGSRR
jgi:hypothetical protein